ncbi:MAG: DUF6261 family protein, partial [Mangrovibacterium sp.]
ELAATLELILSLIKKSDLLQHDKNIATLFNKLSDLHQALQNSLVPTMEKSQLTQKDLARKKTYANLFGFLKGLMLVPEASEDVQPIYELMCRFGNSAVTRSNQREASALINSFLWKLRSENYATHLNCLESTELILPIVEQLEQAQRDFEAEQLVQIRRVATRRKRRTATDIREEILRLINNDFANYLSVSALLKEAQYGDLLRMIELTISRNNTAVHRGLRMKARKSQVPESSSEQVAESSSNQVVECSRLSLKTKAAPRYYVGESAWSSHRRMSPNTKLRHRWKPSYQEKLRQR